MTTNSKKEDTKSILEFTNSEIPDDFQEQVKAILEGKDLRELNLLGYTISRLRSGDFNNNLSAKRNDLLKEFRSLLTWDEEFRVRADVHYELDCYTCEFISEPLTEEQVLSVISGNELLEEVTETDLDAFVMDNADEEVTYSQEYDACGSVEVKNIALKGEDPYEVFKKAIFLSLDGHDDDSKANATLVKELKEGNPVEVSRWIEKAMIEWRAS